MIHPVIVVELSRIRVAVAALPPAAPALLGAGEVLAAARGVHARPLVSLPAGRVGQVEG